jgi:hypothetical protein
MLFSAVHVVQMLVDNLREATNPAEIEARRAMAAVAVDIGPFHTHMGKLFQLLGASYSTLLFFVAALNLVALPAIVAHGRLRAMAMANAIFVGILLAIAVIYQFPPPGVFSLVALMFFIAALVKAGADTSANAV